MAESAEKIKREAGCAYEPLVEDGEPVIVPGVGGRPPIQASRGQVCQVIQPRMTEIFRMVRERLDKQRLLDRIAGGLVLTGGGANLPGVVELGQDMFNLGGRIGQPHPRARESNHPLVVPNTCNGATLWSCAMDL